MGLLGDEGSLFPTPNGQLAASSARRLVAIGQGWGLARARVVARNFSNHLTAKICSSVPYRTNTDIPWVSDNNYYHARAWWPHPAPRSPSRQVTPWGFIHLLGDSPGRGPAGWSRLICLAAGESCRAIACPIGVMAWPCPKYIVHRICLRSSRRLIKRKLAPAGKEAPQLWAMAP